MGQCERSETLRTLIQPDLSKALAPPAPQRIPGRLRSRGPLSQPNVLLEPMDPGELESWESSTLLPEAPQR